MPLHDAAQQPAIALIQSQLIHPQPAQAKVGGFAGDPAVAAHFGEIAHPVEQLVGDARRATRAPADFERAFLVEMDAEDAGRTLDNGGELGWLVEIEALDDAKAREQRRGELAGARGGAHQGEAFDGHRDGAGARTHAGHDLDLEVLHRRVEALLDDGLQPVDLVDEQDIAATERGEDARQVALALQRRPGCHARLGAHLVRQQVRQGGLAQARRPGQKHVIQGSAALLGRGHIDLQVLDHLAGKGGGKIRFLPNWFKPTRLGRLRERLFVVQGGALTPLLPQKA